MSQLQAWWPELAVVGGVGVLAFLATRRLMARGVRRDVVGLAALIIAFLFALALCAPRLVAAMEKGAGAPIVGSIEPLSNLKGASS